jgi:hypothetical protein
MSKSVTPDQYSALRRLADVLRGIAQTLMLAYGFRDELICRRCAGRGS